MIGLLKGRYSERQAAFKYRYTAMSEIYKSQKLEGKKADEPWFEIKFLSPLARLAGIKHFKVNLLPR